MRREFGHSVLSGSFVVVGVIPFLAVNIWPQFTHFADAKNLRPRTRLACGRRTKVSSDLTSKSYALLSSSDVGGSLLDEGVEPITDLWAELGRDKSE